MFQRAYALIRELVGLCFMRIALLNVVTSFFVSCYQQDKDLYVSAAKNSNAAKNIPVVGLKLPTPVSKSVAILSEGTVLETVMNFENLPVGKYAPLDHLWYYVWGTDNEQQGRAYSTLDVVSDVGTKALRLWINDQIPNAITSFDSPNSLANLKSVIRAFSISPYLRPEVDAVRIKIKLEQGQIGLALGSPVSQVGNSDVLTAVKYLSPAQMSDCNPKGGNWYECDFDLNDGLMRNARRGNFSLDSLGKAIKYSIGSLRDQEIIHYTRWVQEPLALYVVTYDSNDRLAVSGNPIVYFDDFQLINKGKGKSFPVIGSSVQRHVVDTFESSISNVFTVNFQFPTAQPAPVLSQVVSGSSGLKSLQIVSNTHEENAWTGVNATGAGASNAVSFEMKVSYGYPDGDTNHIVEFIALASDPGIAFNWTGLNDITREFSFILSKINSITRNFAVYHARRIVPRDQWVTVVIPFADFVAAYGSGSVFMSHHTEQRPLLGSEISVVGLQTSWVNSRGPTTIQIDSIKYLSVQGTDQELRSYWQKTNGN
jgi:hypothetical protein